MTSAENVTRGSGNVFADLGLSDPDVRLLRVQLAAFINGEIQRRQLRQIDAALVLKCRQSRVSELRNLKLHIFSLEQLIRFARRLGATVTLTVEGHRR